MPPTNPYLTGTTQYGASSSPTRGTTLNPTGYINRESDRRSQLAQRALQSFQGGQTQQTQAAPQAQASALAPSNPYDFSNRTATGRILGMPLGSISQPVSPITSGAPEGQPPDETYNAQAWQAANDWQTQARDLLAQRQQMDLDYTKGIRGLQEQYDIIPGQARSGAGKSGMLYSSFFGKSLDDMLSGVGQQASDLNESYNFGSQAYDKGMGDLTSQYDSLMSLAAQNLASRNAANAGKLGLGTPAEGDLTTSTSEIQRLIDSIVNRPIPQVPLTTPSIAAPSGGGGGGGGIGAGLPTSGLYSNVSNSRDPVVRIIQQIVGTKVDGVFGNNTRDAVKAWQAQHGLKADGIVGRDTLAAMRGA